MSTTPYSSRTKYSAGLAARDAGSHSRSSLAALVAREEIAKAFSPGMHGTTFGGGPLQCRLALKVLEILGAPGFLARVAEVGGTLRLRLEELKEEFPVIREVRGEGLMAAAELTVPCKDIVKQALEAGVLLNSTQEKVLRFLPPLVVEPRHVDELIRVLKPILAGISVPEKKEVHA